MKKLLKLFCIILLITPYILGHTYGIKTHLPEGSNDVQTHYRVEYSSPLTTTMHIDNSPIASSYQKPQTTTNCYTDKNHNTVCTEQNVNLNNGADNIVSSTYVVKHETKRFGDNSGYDAFVDNVLNKNLQEHQNILENIQTTYGNSGKVVYEGALTNTGSHGSELESSVTHQKSLGESQGNLRGSISTISLQRNFDGSLDNTRGNVNGYDSNLQTSISHGKNGALNYVAPANAYGSNNLGTKITHHNSLLENSNLQSSISHSNKGYDFSSSTQNQDSGSFGPGVGSSTSYASSKQGTGLESSISHGGSNTHGSNLGSSISYGNKQIGDYGLSSSHSASNGYILSGSSSTQNQDSGPFGPGGGSSTTYASNKQGTGLGSSISHAGSNTHGSSLGSSISYGNNKQIGDHGLSSSHSASNGYASSGSSSYDIYNGSDGSNLYQQHYSYVKSHKFSKCPPGVTGQFAIPDNCHKFLNCWQGDGHVQDCGAGTVFNEKIRGCDFPSGNAYTC